MLVFSVLVRVMLASQLYVPVVTLMRDVAAHEGALYLREGLIVNYNLLLGGC